ncbi:MAG: 5-formyltetrahydrofolate cyclo-ligase [Phycisphaerae bacterium]
MKSELRHRLRARLGAISPEELSRRSTRAAALLFQQPEYQRAGTIMVYLSLPQEVDTTPIVSRAWQDVKRVVAPQVIWESHQMIPIEIHSLENDVSTGAMGLREPIRGEPIPIQEIELIIVPGLAFDPHGNRLGRGRGFYDRFLGRREFKGISCALAIEEQLVDSIPAGPTDVRVKMLVTDQQVRRFA